MRVLNTQRAMELGFSADKRKRRRQHRKAAQQLLKSGGFFNSFSAPGSTFNQIAQWHKAQARAL